MIDEELFDAYAGAIDANAELLARAVESLASRLESSPPSADPAEAVAAAYAALVAEYGSYAAEIACDFYALARDAAGAVGSFEPEMGGGPDGALVADDARRAFEAHPDAPSALRSLAGAAVQRAMQRADATVSANAARDPARPKWALVPQAGACGFCVMLASNGFAYASKATAHPRHPSCRCRPVADFDAANPSLRGYDPGAMRDAYRKCRAAVEADAREKWGAMSAGERAKWPSSGRGGWDHYLRNRVAAEMDSRDRGWLQTGKACGVEFASKKIEDEVRRGRPHEMAAAERLSAHGIKCRFVEDRREYVDGSSGLVKYAGLPDLDGGIELKSLLTARSESAVDRCLRDAGHKEGLSVCVIDNGEGALDDRSVEVAIAEKMGKRGVRNVLLIESDGSVRRFTEKKKASKGP